MTGRDRHLLILAAALWSVLVTVAPATALDDGGGRSVFALGAGNRALAMGGAFGGVADDASASLWNPAGLSLLDRREIQMSHTNLFGMGFSEQYMALANPHWRFGTFALTFRKFGVGGIEHRDDRNVLLADDLEDSETEIGLAFARQVSQGIRAGGVLKLQRHSLAGYSGGGTGLDLGVLITPLALTGAAGEGSDRWTVGVAVRNMVEPNIRLDIDDVPDPRGLRLGSAWRTRVGEDVALLTAVDLEQTRNSNSRWHLGMEADYRGVFALRTGSLAGAWTVGFGVLWRDISFDYAYESNRLGDIQRLGLTMTMGRSIRDVRTERLAAAARERQDQLAAAFAADNERRLAGLMSDAESAFAAGDHDLALEHLGMVRILEPDHGPADRLEVTVLRARAGQEEAAGDLTAAVLTLSRITALDEDNTEAAAELERVRSESDRRAQRSREARDLYDAGFNAFTAGDLNEARRAFGRVLETTPGDHQARAMLDRTDQALARRLKTLADEVRGMTRAGLFDEAAASRAEAALLGAHPDTLQALDATMADARRRQDYDAAQRKQERQRAAELASLSGAAQEPVATADDSQEKALIPASRLRELESLADRGAALAADGRADEAIRIWELVWEESPDVADVRERLVDEYLQRGMEHFAAGRLEEAVGSWDHALRIDPEDRRTRSYLERARGQLARIQRLRDDSGR